KIIFEVQKFFIGMAFSPPSRDSFTARILNVLMTDDGKRGIVPTYSSSAGGGLKFFQRGLISPDSKLSLSVTAGLRDRRRFQLHFKRIALSKIINSEILAKYHFQPDESFFGLGPNSARDDRSNFAHELVRADLDIGFRLNEQNRIAILPGFDRNKILAGRDDAYPSATEVPGFESLPGMNSTVQIAKLELEIHHDSRNHPGIPTAGFEALLRGGVFQEVSGDRFGFTRLKMEVSRFIHLFYNRALKLRVAGELTGQFQDRSIPFYYLSEIGRSETVRGFTRGRFRDKDMILGSIEYRYPVWNIINTYFFLDEGTVANNIFKDLSAKNLKQGYGIGFQMWDAEGVLMDFTIARSREGMRFYLELNTIF
ncbi:MAG: BamA/TamA family outer membrane protein, partial [Calditrichia bacterium]